ncbi:MAG: hypothetical protein HY690_06470 [Chloroflexi bacterium]|nr:hypothetical protein [Chloroflexota bacterium]
MAVTLRFRPVVFGPSARPTLVLHVEEGPDGRAWFRELELALPLDAPLEAVAIEHLPPPYQGGQRGRRFQATILPVQEVTAETAADAHRRMTAALEALETRREPQRPVRNRARAADERAAG